jgi:quinoprotein relay system zinc metallohydrolase 1
MKPWLFPLLLLLNGTAFSDNFNYPIQPQQVATDTYVIEGKTEDFSKANGGFIVNTGFIVTAEGVVVIDTGVSRRFGEQQRAAIEKLTGKNILRVYITHHHPDHFLGNQTYSDVPIYALPATRDGIKAEGETFSGNMYRLIGDWMRDTRITPPTQDAKAGKESIGGHELEVLALQGHTPGDLVVFDHTTGVLFAGDLVFNNRAATTPHATLATWLQTLDNLQALPFKTLVPGHGKVASDPAPLAQTREWLQWLQATLTDAAANGLDMTEVMQTPIPAEFKDVALAQNELRRSVSHLYPALEQANLKPAKQVE